MADEHGLGDVQRIEESQNESRVISVRVAVRRLVREPEAAVVQGDRAESRRGDPGQGVPPRVQGRAETVNQDDRRTGPGLDVPDPRSSTDTDRAVSAVPAG